MWIDNKYVWVGGIIIATVAEVESRRITITNK